MIVVRVELHSAITGRRTELARMHICNVGGTPQLGDYEVRTLHGRERTEWHRVVIFNPGLCEIAERYLKKGSKLYVEGQLSTRKWTDQAGVERYATEVVLQRFAGQLALLDKPVADPGRSDYSGHQDSRAVAAAPAQAQPGWRSDPLDDDTPF